VTAITRYNPAIAYCVVPAWQAELFITTDGEDARGLIYDVALHPYPIHLMKQMAGVRLERIIRSDPNRLAGFP